MGVVFNSLVSDKIGSLSATRVSFLMCTFISNMVVFFIWGGLCISQSKLLEIPESIIFLYCLANGITFTGKLVQKQIESNGNGNGNGKKEGDKK
jgi:hypothetical protein